MGEREALEDLMLQSRIEANGPAQKSQSTCKIGMSSVQEA